MSGVSLHGGLERPLCKAMKVKPGLPWRPQNVGDDRAVGYFQRRDPNRGISPWERGVLQPTKLKGAGGLKSTFDIRRGDTEFGVSQLFFGSVFLHYAPCRIIMDILCHYVEDHGEEQQMALELMEYGLPVAQS